MTADLWARNLVALGLQQALVIAAGALVWRVLQVRRATVTLAYWRAVLAACVLLPFGQPWQVPPAIPAPTHVAAVEDTDGLTQNETARARPLAASEPRLNEALLLALGAGAVARLAWLSIGAFGLRRQRRAATRLEPLPTVVREAQTTVGARAEFYVSDDTAGPTTFGLRRPVVLLPPAVLSMDDSLQSAIVSHELLHVRRRDWLDTLTEEAIRTVFWFHPGIWWLTERIRLSREHVVDDGVIALTRARESYVEALVAVAMARTCQAPAPAPLFLRRRFLKKRVEHIFEEAVMTTRRLLASVTVGTVALMLATVLATRSFPLEAQAPARPAGGEASGGPVQIISGGQYLLHGPLPEYPRRAIERRVEGDVALEVSLDERGEVSDARVVSGPDELRRTSLESVLQWHYAANAQQSSPAQVILRFQVPPPTTEQNRAYAIKEPTERGSSEELALAVERYRALQSQYVAALKQYEHARIASANETPQTETRQMLTEVELARRRLIETERQLEKMHAAATVQRAPANVLGRLSRIRSERVPQEVLAAIRERAEFSLGDEITTEIAGRIREAARSIDEHLEVRFERDASGGVVLIVIAR